MEQPSPQDFAAARRPGGLASAVARHPVALPVLAGWAMACALLLAIFHGNIAPLWYSDTDDAMRMLEVTDWVAGQSWWDVSQHRLWNGDFQMHWSRLVDLPIAGVLVALTPLVGEPVALRAAVVAVPLLTLLAIMAAGALLIDRLAGRDRVALGVMLVPLATPVLAQVMPLRIDHHGWQIALALAAVAALVGRDRADARSGILGGVALATLLTISLEGMPVTAAIVAVTLAAWAFVPERRPQALALVLTLFAGLIVLHVATRGPAMFAPVCDAIAPGWLATLGVALAGAALVMIVPVRHWWQRLGLLALAGAAAGATLLLVAPQCLSGPFGTLDPLVYRIWYLNVLEGMPVWRQEPAIAARIVGFPLFGMIGCLLARRAATGEARTRWTMMLAMLGAATLTALFVARGGGTANALALPGGAWALGGMMRRARAIRRPVTRTVATMGALMIAAPGLTAGAIINFAAPTPVEATATPYPTCDNYHDVAKLATLPPATIFAPIDMTPALLAATHHRAIGAGYHRNSAALHRVLAAFLASPDRARALVTASGADYLIGCPGMSDAYRRYAPNGLWARLERGERVSWLTPIPTNSPMLLWRVARDGAVTR